ncbi:VOC family protein [Streptomyces lydicus]|uniref:VOC family protein n=1 Tax=Streptomyces lydicus TaxID=47763 RepID=UPI000F8D39CD|nr:VOC family protein [Streptomyces lydicus]
MSVSLRAVVIESPDPVALGAFWSAVLESSIDSGTDGVVIRFGQHREQLLYIIEGSGRHSRGHEPFMCVTAADATLDEEVDRLVKLGAVVIKRKWNVNRELNVGFALMADTEGNCFQVLSSNEEVQAAERMLESESW